MFYMEYETLLHFILVAQKPVITCSMIYDFCGDNRSLIVKGEAAYTDGYVEKFSFFPSISPPLIKAQVKASMKKKRYEVEVSPCN